jgi:uncharacterized membrane protein
MNVARTLRHLFATHWGTRRRFTPHVLGNIEKTIAQVESQHAGEIRFVVETALHPLELWRGLTPRQRALLADRAVEILADRGIAAQVAAAEWQQICREMEHHYGAGDFGRGSVAGVLQVGRLLERHFPGARGSGRDELPNKPLLL